MGAVATVAGLGSAANPGGITTWAWAISTMASLLAISGLILYLAYRLAQARRGGEGHDGEDDAGGGGGWGRRPDRPQPRGGDPAWWPEFEQQFADHIAHRRSPAGSPEPREPVGV